MTAVWRRLILIFFFLGLIPGCKDAGKSPELIPSEVLINKFYSQIGQTDFNYRVYLPKGYDSLTSYPVLYLMHGHGGHDDDWFSDEEGRVKSILDSLNKNDKIPHVVAVTMDASNSWYVDANVRMETIYMKEFMPYIEENYLPENEKTFRVLAGNSAGGYGALRFGLKYPNLFNDVILLSPASYFPSPPEISSSRIVPQFQVDSIFNDSLWRSFSYTNFLKPKGINVSYPFFHISTGKDDKYGILGVVNDVKSRLDSLNYRNGLIIVDGDHTWDVWRERFAHDITTIFQNYRHDD